MTQPGSPEFSGNGAAQLPAVVGSRAIVPLWETYPQFDDFAGLDNEIGQLREVGMLYGQPEMCQDMDIECPTGVLLHGPGGVGKTELVRALTRDLRADLYQVAPSEVMGSYVGDANRGLKRIFDMARTLPGRVVIFFDEMDGLFAEGAGGNTGYSTTLISEFKMILGNLKQTQPNTLVAGTANNTSRIPEALMRPGRFDIVIPIGLPSQTSRSLIFGKYITNRATLYDLGIDTNEEDFDVANIMAAPKISTKPCIDFEKLALATEGMTGNDIRDILQMARKGVALRHLNSGKPAEAPKELVTESHILDAISRHRRSRLDSKED